MTPRFEVTPTSETKSKELNYHENVVFSTHLLIGQEREAYCGKEDKRRMNSMSKKIDVKCKNGSRDDLISFYFLICFRSCQMHSTAIFKASLEAYVPEAKIVSHEWHERVKLPRPSKELKKRLRERHTQDTTHELKEVEASDWIKTSLFSVIDFILLILIKHFKWHLLIPPCITDLRWVHFDGRSKAHARLIN